VRSQVGKKEMSSEEGRGRYLREKDSFSLGGEFWVILGMKRRGRTNVVAGGSNLKSNRGKKSPSPPF